MERDIDPTVGDSTDADLPGRYDPAELAAFLATAPAGLKGWADAQLAQLGPIAADEANVDDGAVGVEAFADDFEQPKPPRPAAKKPTGTLASKTGLSKVNLVLVTLLAAAVVIIVQQMGRPAPTQGASGELPSSHPSISSGAQPSGMTEFDEVDQARVDELTAAAEADPTNVDIRMELGELLLNAGLYQDALVWFNQVLEIDPNHLDGLLASGVAAFNLGMDVEAEAHWLKATEVAPERPQPWYNLGFLYMAQTPPDYDKAEQAWNKVIELAPESELAATAAAHLERMRQSSPTPSSGG